MSISAIAQAKIIEHTYLIKFGRKVKSVNPPLFGEFATQHDRTMASRVYRVFYGVKIVFLIFDTNNIKFLSKPSGQAKKINNLVH